jgi:hypothetical protein
MSGILTQTVGQCKMQIWRHPENSNQTTDVFTFHLLKLGSVVAQLLSRSSIMTVGTSSKYIQCAQKCGSNIYTKCHKMALSKSQICSILQHSIFEFFQKNMLRSSEQFLPPICALKFVEMLLEGFGYALSIMVVNLNIFNKI